MKKINIVVDYVEKEVRVYNVRHDKMVSISSEWGVVEGEPQPILDEGNIYLGRTETHLTKIKNVMKGIEYPCSFARILKEFSEVAKPQYEMN